MFNSIQTARIVGATILAMALVLVANSASLARRNAASVTAPSIGYVRLNVTKAGAFVGVGGGGGTLSFRGRTYQLGVGGIGIGTVGIAAADLAGRAYNLRTAADIAGPYTAVGGGIAVFGGGSTVQLKNANGVVLELRGLQAGFEFAMSLSGVTISLL